MFPQVRHFLHRFLQNKSGVSVIFGALLLLSIFSVFLSVFLITALPALEMYRESAESDLLFRDVLNFSETVDAFSSFSNASDLFLFARGAAVSADENGGKFLFRADMTLPPDPAAVPESVSFPDYFELSSGSVVFINAYTQIPDQFYFYGPAGLILCQEDGASFIRRPPVSLTRGEDDRILLRLSGRLIRNGDPLISESSGTVHVRGQTVYLHDFISEIEIRYIPPPAVNIESDEIFYENRDIAVEKYLSETAVRIGQAFPEIEAVYRDEIVALTLSSDVPMEADIQIMTLIIDFE